MSRRRRGPALTVLRHETRWYGPLSAQAGTRLPGASSPRVVTIVRCRDAESGTVFDLANTHLDEHISDNRAASVRQLAGWLDRSVPTVVLGDFNTDPGDEVLAPLLENGLQRVPAYGGTSHDFTGSAHGRRLDHIYASAHWTVEDAAVVYDRPRGRLPSNHWPVRAELGLQS